MLAFGEACADEGCAEDACAVGGDGDGARTEPDATGESAYQDERREVCGESPFSELCAGRADELRSSGLGPPEAPSDAALRMATPPLGVSRRELRFQAGLSP